MDLKNQNSRVSTVFLITVFYNNCVPHCDDKDYTRGQKEAEITKANSLLVIKQ